MKNPATRDVDGALDANLPIASPVGCGAAMYATSSLRWTSVVNGVLLYHAKLLIFWAKAQSKIAYPAIVRAKPLLGPVD
jgi:hypothetical protein